jgi:hypothetical protein
MNKVAGTHAVSVIAPGVAGFGCVCVLVHALVSCPACMACHVRARRASYNALCSAISFSVSMRGRAQVHGGVA